jgi:hypothetical protein
MRLENVYFRNRFYRLSLSDYPVHFVIHGAINVLRTVTGHPAYPAV